MSWQLQEAKQRFSELVRRALRDGPQTVTRNGKEVVVVVSADDFHAAPAPDFADFLLDGPGFDGLDLSGPRQPPREVDLGT